MSNDHSKYGKAFLGKLLTVLAIPALFYYCVTRPEEKKNQELENEINERYKNESPFERHDPFKEQRQEWQESIPTQLPRDSF